MSDQTIVTPYFLDRYLPALAAVAADDAILNAPELPDADLQARLSALHAPLAAAVAAALRAGRRPVSLAGDCCAAIGMLAGLQRSGLQPLLLWFDAHGDFNTWETTPSGFLGGMPLAMLVGRGEQRLIGALGMAHLPETDVILTDARDLDPGEREAVQQSAVRWLPQIEQLDLAQLADRPLWVHFDVDILNLDDNPAVSYPAAGGPSAAALGRLFDALAASGRVAAISLSAWNPDLDHDGRGQQHSLALLARLLTAADSYDTNRKS